MKKISLMTLALLMVCMASAQDINELRRLGLPAKAMPAATYFENLYNDSPQAATDLDIQKSSIFSFDNDYCFFVEKLPSTEEDMFARINLWMFNAEAKKVTKIFSQQDNEYKELFVMGVDWLLDKQSTFKDVIVKDTKQKISLQEFTGSPVVILKAEEFTGFSHSPQFTLLVYPLTKEVKMLPEYFVSVFHTLSNMLMSAEQEYAQDYIITTTTDTRSEQQPLKESEEYTMYYKQYLTPEIHVYNARGKLIKSLTLPEDEVDMIR